MEIEVRRTVTAFGEGKVAGPVVHTLFLVSMMFCWSGGAVWSQVITPKAPVEPAAVPVGRQDGSAAAGARVYPDAVPLVNEHGETAVLESTRQSVVRSGDDKIFILDGAVVVTLGERMIRADHVEYDQLTGNVTADGHLVLTGGPNHEHLEASHGTLNLKSDTGRFYDVTGSVEMSEPKARDGRVGPKVYSNGRPFLFTGRIVVKTGPTSYDLYEGTVTSCQLPKPDWILQAGHFSVTDKVARGQNSTFRLLNVPILFFPYVTHPTDPDARQTGFMIPSVGLSTSRGVTLEEQFYLVLGRSMDLTVGAAYYSKIGWAQDATLRYRGAGLNFVKAHYTGVIDRRTSGVQANGSVFENQQGEDVVLSVRHDFSSETRLASDLEYLSSYVYREAFTDSFNQAVTSDILSRVYLTHADRGFELAALVDRYQGIKLIAQGTSPQQQVRIFHAPALSVATTEHRLGDSALEWTLDASTDGLKRQQPNFATGGIVERIDVRPEFAVPFHLGEWRLRPSVGMEETAYTRSLNPASPGVPPSQRDSRLSRTDVHGEFSVRSPVLERVYQPSHWTGVLGSALKHTVELETTYRIRSGVDDFRHTLRFDPIDVVSNTHEVEYGITQRIFRKRRSAKSCSAGTEIPDASEVDQTEADEGGFNPDPTLSVGNEVGAYSAAGQELCQNDELISWRLTQKYFLDRTFGGAIQNGRRNVFDTTLSLSGVAFLTEPREISPLVSRLRVRASTHADVEWDFDYDTGASKFTSSNLYVDGHANNGLFGALSYARLDAPGRFYTEGVTNNSTTGGVSTLISDFNQLRLLLGYGGPTKRGLSLAANAGLDLKSITGATSTVTSSNGVAQSSVTVYPALLQYATLQASYNWDCCGLSVEYRKFELGSVRNEGAYRFNFTLANIGTAGNLRRSARLF